MNKFFDSIIVVIIIFAVTYALKKGDRLLFCEIKSSLSPFSISSITPKTPQDFILLGQKININTAGIEALEVLPGIGRSLAQKIVNYRMKNGPFKSFDELDAVNGVGPKKLETLQRLTSF